MSTVCILRYLCLMFIGIQLIRQRLNMVYLLTGVLIFEAAYFFSIPFLWILTFQSPKRGLSIAGATGIATGGLMFQFILLFPLWGPMLASRAKKRSLETPLGFRRLQ